MPSTAAYLAIGGVAAVVTFLLTPIVGWFARRVGWVVEPDARRVHKVTTPDVGGIAMFGGFAAGLHRSPGWSASFAPLFAANSEPYGIFLGAVGDVRRRPARRRPARSPRPPRWSAPWSSR